MGCLRVGPRVSQRPSAHTQKKWRPRGRVPGGWWAWRGPAQCWPAGWKARRVGALRVGPRRVGGPKISRFFTLSRRKFCSFFPLSGGLFRGIVAAVQGHGPPKVRVSACPWSFCASPGGLQGAGPLRPSPRKISVTTAATAATAVARRSGTLRGRWSGGGKNQKKKETARERTREPLK